MNKGGFLRFPKTLQEDAGKYTCLVDVSIDGKTYTAARSTQVNVKEGMTLDFKFDLVLIDFTEVSFW